MYWWKASIQPLFRTVSAEKGCSAQPPPSLKYSLVHKKVCRVFLRLNSPDIVRMFSHLCELEGKDLGSVVPLQLPLHLTLKVNLQTLLHKIFLQNVSRIILLIIFLNKSLSWSNLYPEQLPLPNKSLSWTNFLLNKLLSWTNPFSWTNLSPGKISLLKKSLFLNKSFSWTDLSLKQISFPKQIFSWANFFLNKFSPEHIYSRANLFSWTNFSHE